MTVAFTSIMAIFIVERVDEKTGTTSIAPLVIAGILTILYWRQACDFSCFFPLFFDDLRPYALIQFLPCIIIPLMTILIPPMYTHSSYWLWAAGQCFSFTPRFSSPSSSSPSFSLPRLIPIDFG
ncbi:hypothetical protein GW17_00038414 [Ensete ventricosum]|nr:hypothetical protein GW17_00038414 [Ensete ventricosum]RZS21008.1 hypothetical protein BHM03_00053596 [Ensete ventricosum]